MTKLIHCRLRVWTWHSTFKYKHANYFYVNRFQWTVAYESRSFSSKVAKKILWIFKKIIVQWNVYELRLAEHVCPFDESKRSNNGVMMQRMPRKRSHPIRVRDVPSTTRRLCSEANKELENEYEDLRLISDSSLAPRNEANKPVNKLKNRYANVLPCKAAIIGWNFDNFNDGSVQMMKLASFWASNPTNRILTTSTLRTLW